MHLRTRPLRLPHLKCVLSYVNSLMRTIQPPLRIEVCQGTTDFGTCHSPASLPHLNYQLPITKWPRQSGAPVGAAPPTRSQLRLQRHTQVPVQNSHNGCHQPTLNPLLALNVCYVRSPEKATSLLTGRKDAPSSQNLLQQYLHLLAVTYQTVSRLYTSLNQLNGPRTKCSDHAQGP